MIPAASDSPAGRAESRSIEAAIQYIARREPIHHVSGAGRINSNLLETPACYWLQIALPGVDSEALSVEVLPRKVTVRGRYSIPAIPGSTTVWHDIIGGDIFEVYTLPFEVDAQAARAEYQRGILILTLPKRQDPDPTPVYVRAE